MAQKDVSCAGEPATPSLVPNEVYRRWLAHAGILSELTGTLAALPLKVGSNVEADVPFIDGRGDATAVHPCWA